jgi:hypothetical protein
VDYDVPGQQIVDLRYFLPRADCSAAAGAAPMYGVAVTRKRTLREPMAADGKRFLHRIWRTECTARRIARAVSVRYGDTWTLEGTGPRSVLHGTLVLTREHGDEPIAVDQVEGSVLFDLTTSGDTVLAPGSRARRSRWTSPPGGAATRTHAARAPRPSSSGRSSGSATRIPSGRLVVPTHRQQARLLAFLDQACGEGSGP